MRLTVVFIAFLVGGWLTFDGTRSFVTGSYVTRDGKLGPWARVVGAVGLAPQGTAMKVIHVGLGLAWVAAAAFFLGLAPFARNALLACSVLTLWYLPVGTILSVVEITLLCLPALRK